MIITAAVAGAGVARAGSADMPAGAGALVPAATVTSVPPDTTLNQTQAAQAAAAKYLQQSQKDFALGAAAIANGLASARTACSKPVTPAPVAADPAPLRGATTSGEGAATIVREPAASGGAGATQAMGQHVTVGAGADGDKSNSDPSAGAGSSTGNGMAVGAGTTLPPPPPTPPTPDVYISP